MSDVVAQLRAELGERVLTDERALAAHARDTWVLTELEDLEGSPPAPPLAVVEAASTEDVSRALAICRAAREAGAVTPSPRLSAQQRSAVLSLLQTLDPGGGCGGSGSGSRHENSRQRKHRKKVSISSQLHHTSSPQTNLKLKHF